MKLVKLPFKIFALPVMLVFGALLLIVKLATNLSCYIVLTFMLFLSSCCVYAIVMRLWSQLGILAVLLLGCVVMLFGASWIIVFLENTTGRLSDFVHE